MSNHISTEKFVRLRVPIYLQEKELNKFEDVQTYSQYIEQQINKKKLFISALNNQITRLNKIDDKTKARNDNLYLGDSDYKEVFPLNTYKDKFSDSKDCKWWQVLKEGYLSEKREKSLEKREKALEKREKTLEKREKSLGEKSLEKREKSLGEKSLGERRKITPRRRSNNLLRTVTVRGVKKRNKKTKKTQKGGGKTIRCWGNISQRHGAKWGYNIHLSPNISTNYRGELLKRLTEKSELYNYAGYENDVTNEMPAFAGIMVWGRKGYGRNFAVKPDDNGPAVAGGGVTLQEIEDSFYWLVLDTNMWKADDIRDAGAGAVHETMYKAVSFAGRNDPRSQLCTSGFAIMYDVTEEKYEYRFSSSWLNGQKPIDSIYSADYCNNNGDRIMTNGEAWYILIAGSVRAHGDSYIEISSENMRWAQGRKTKNIGICEQDCDQISDCADDTVELCDTDESEEQCNWVYDGNIADAWGP